MKVDFSNHFGPIGPLPAQDFSRRVDIVGFAVHSRENFVKCVFFINESLFHLLATVLNIHNLLFEDLQFLILRQEQFGRKELNSVIQGQNG
jgi:hypothetical protein